MGERLVIYGAVLIGLAGALVMLGHGELGICNCLTAIWLRMGAKA